MYIYMLCCVSYIYIYIMYVHIECVYIYIYTWNMPTCLWDEIWHMDYRLIKWDAHPDMGNGKVGEKHIYRLVNSGI